MIKKLLARFGYFPSSEVELAYREGYDRGFDDMHRNHESVIENVKLQYSDIERHRNYLMKLFVDNAKLRAPKLMIVQKSSSSSISKKITDHE